MDILENQKQWQTQFESGWLANFEATGEIDWSIYNRPVNTTAPAGKGITLSDSRLILISTAGGYLPASQTAFDAEHPIGDYTIRTFPATTAPGDIAFAHTHYDHTAVNADQQVLLPLGHLAEMVDEGIIGELAPEMISFSGYQPDVGQVIDDLIPAIVAAAQRNGAQGALLVPA